MEKELTHSNFTNLLRFEDLFSCDECKNIFETYNHLITCGINILIFDFVVLKNKFFFNVTILFSE